VPKKGFSLLILIAARGFASPPEAKGQQSTLSNNPQNVQQEQACASVVREYFNAYKMENLSGMLATFDTKSPHLGEMKAEAGEFFSTYGGPQVTQLKMNKIGEADHRVELRVSYELSATDLKTHKPATDLGPTVRSLVCVKTGGSWKIWQDADAVEALATQLIATKSAPERKALLDHEKELVSPALVEELNHQGEQQQSKDKLEEAASDFQIAEETAEMLNDQHGVSAALLNLGIVTDIGGRKRESLALYDQSLQIAQAQGDKRLTARVLVNRGNAYFSLGELREALNDFAKSLELAESLQEKRWIARLLHNIGEVNVLLGNHTEGKNYFDKALRVYESQDDKRGTAQELRGIGVIYLRQGNNSLAFDFFQRSIAALDKSRDKELLRHLYDDIGQIYESQRDFPQALTYYHKSLALSKELDNQLGSAAALENIGIAELEQEHYTAASANFQQSLAIFDKVGLKQGTLAVLGNLGEVEYGRGNLESALAYQKKSMALAESIGDLENLGQAAASSAMIYNKQQKFRDALDSALRATEIARKISSPNLEWQTLTIAGQAHENLGENAEARKFFLDAISTVELLRAQVAGGEEEQQSFLSSRLTPYYNLVALLEAQQPAEAFAVAEQAKARALLDVLHNGKMEITKAMTSAEREQEKQLQVEMVSLNKQLEQENDKEKPDSERTAGLKSRIQAVRLSYGDLQTTLFATHPQLKTQRGQVQPLGVQEAGRLLPDSRSALLEFVVGEEKSFLFVLRNKTEDSQGSPELKVYVIIAGQKELRQKAERFRELVGRRDLAFRPSARELYKILLQPAEAQLKGTDTLILVPDGPLWSLPFQALIAADGRYVLETRAISYAPSLTVLNEMIRVREKNREEVGVAEPPTLLALANPLLARETLAQSTAVYRGETLGPLPGAQREALALKQVYGVERAKVYTGADAGEDRFKADAGKFRVLHLATHGIYNDASPMYSGILLAKGKADSNQDGVLEAWEILQLELNADLVVLSACETARGRVSAGEGVIGLTWAFFVAGVPSAVVSQWKVESESTSKLMVDFHRNLKNERPEPTPAFATAKALQAAELRVLHTAQYAHPFYWAPFVLVGNPR